MLVNSKPARICISNFSLHWIILIFCSNKTICFACSWSVLIYTAASPQACFLLLLAVLDRVSLLCLKRCGYFPGGSGLFQVFFSFLLAVAFCFFRCCLNGLYWKWQGHGARGWGILAISIGTLELLSDRICAEMRVNNNATFINVFFHVHFLHRDLKTSFKNYKSIQVRGHDLLCEALVHMIKWNQQWTYSIKLLLLYNGVFINKCSLL